MKKAISISLCIFVVATMIIGCAQEPSVAPAQTEDDAEITEELDTLDDLDSLDEELDDISFDELDDLELE
ncbi:MAG: hypothetical protein CMH61_00530 [Nanoarchaeota archaeon]|nr:hypothetical protein [Nanoarchaeota archaeon]|tara:strand:- start:7300 stop:7509 length:210 start_codon:yes stop_codon:yes gene_type:complete